MLLMFTDLTADDRFILGKYRLNRFRKLFVETLSLCHTQVDANQTLLIHCSEPWVVDQLMADLAPLCWQAWVVLGASQLAIYYADEEIYCTVTHTWDNLIPHAL